MDEYDFIQDLFWKNMPFGDKIGWSKHYWENAKINGNNPSFLFTGQGFLRINECLTEKQLKSLENIEVLDVYLSEPVTYYNQNHPKPNDEISVQTRMEDLPIIELLELKELSQFKIERNINTIRVFTCDYNINKYFKDRYPNLDLYCYDTFLSLVLVDSEFTTKLINAKFFCTNARFDTHRHLIMSYLIGRSGYYTWYYRTYYDIKNNYWSDKKGLPWKALRKGSKTLNKTRLPKNENVPLIDVHNPFKFYNPEFKKEVGKVYEKNITRAFCCIVNETRFAQHTANFSEKTTIPISYGSPFVLVAPPLTLQYLREFGFKTFSQWWDESYDEIHDPNLRMKKILEVIDFIDQKSPKQLKKIYNEMIPTLKYNAEHAAHVRDNYDQYIFKN